MWVDDASLSARHSFALRSTATAYAEARTLRELRELLAEARSRGLRVIPLGEGSNFLPAPRLDALCVRYTDDRLELVASGDRGARLDVGAGVNWHRLVAHCLEAGFHGLENLALIPGSVGAAPIQNIGAYGVEVAASIEQVDAVELDTGRFLSLRRDDCAFGYRDSAFKNRWRDRLLITGVRFFLPQPCPPVADYPGLRQLLAERALPASPRHIFDAVVTLRRERLPDPAATPNAGSFFKNPVVPEALARRLEAVEPALPSWPAGPGTRKLSAAWLIERAGWKGRRRGPVLVHPGHALVLVNDGAGDLGDVLALAAQIAGDVRERFGVELEIEPRCYGGSHD